MLYLPLSPSIRKRLKTFVDVFVDRVGRAVAGVLILLFGPAFLAFGTRGTATVAMVLTFICLVVCFKLGRSYVNAFRQQLARREVELGDVSHFVRDPAAVQLLVAALEGKNERRILYALQLLQSVRKVDFSEQLLPLFSHPSPHVREAALRTLMALPRDYSAEATRMLEDVSGRVRLAAVGYLCANEFSGSVATLQSLLDHPQTEIRLAAAQWASSNPMPDFQPSIELVDSLCAVQGPQAVEARATAAALGAYLPRDDSRKLLSRLLDDPDPVVKAAAAKAAGTAGHLNLVFEVASFLSVGKTRSVGRAGLLCYGERIVGTLRDLLGDSRGSLALRRQIPWVLSRIPVQESVDTLSDHLGSQDSTIRLRCAKALNRLHETSQDLKMPSAVIDRSVRDEIRAYYETLAMSRTFDSQADGNRQRGLLQRALHERMDQRLEMIFRLLGLEHDQRDIYSAYLALKGQLTDRRTSAIEFLDNVLHRDLKPLVLPLLEESNPDALLGRAKRLFGIQSAGTEEALKGLLAQNDNWLKSCALYEIGRGRIKELSESCRTLTNEKDLVVKQTATWALAQCVGDRTG
jgi:HEAT repeat protein